MKKKKHKAIAEEIANDPSLKYVQYQWGESIWSDDRQETVRFIRYEDEMIRIAESLGIREIPVLVNPLSVRRATTNAPMSDDTRKAKLEEIIVRRKLHKNNSLL